MTRVRFVRAGAGIAVASLLLLQLSAGIVSGAVPLATATTQAIPAEYSANNDAGFRGIFHYQDTSTLAKVFVHVGITGAEIATSSVTFVRLTKNGGTISNACTVTANAASPDPLSVDCSAKTIRSNDRLVLTIGVAGNGSSVTAGYLWSTTGSTSSDGGTSHGDTWPSTGPAAATARLNPSANYAGGFNENAIANSQALSDTNPQAARLSNLPAATAATVKDGLDASGTCQNTSDVDCTDLFGEWVEVTVGDGQSFTQAFSLAITFSSNTKPAGFVHSYADFLTGLPVQEFIEECPRGGNTPSAGDIPCFKWSSQTRTATIFSFHNGSFKGSN